MILQALLVGCVFVLVSASALSFNATVVKSFHGIIYRCTEEHALSCFASTFTGKLFVEFCEDMNSGEYITFASYQISGPPDYAHRSEANIYVTARGQLNCPMRCSWGTGSGSQDDLRRDIGVICQIDPRLKCPDMFIEFIFDVPGSDPGCRNIYKDIIPQEFWAKDAESFPSLVSHELNVRSEVEPIHILPPTAKLPKNVPLNQDWMKKYLRDSSLQVRQLLLPGSHNSGIDKEVSNCYANYICQDYGVGLQLQHGIRVLEIRPQFFPRAESLTERYYTTHAGPIGDCRGRRILEILDSVNRFRSYPNTDKEIIILHFREFMDWTAEAEDEFVRMLYFELDYEGGPSKLIPYSRRDDSLKTLMDEGLNLIVVYENKGGEKFWPSLRHHWSGDHLISTNALFQWIDAKQADGSISSDPNDLEAVQVAKYVLPGFVPDDFSDRISQETQLHLLNGYTIINTDWSTRSNYVAHLIAGNRARTRAAKL